MSSSTSEAADDETGLRRWALMAWRREVWGVLNTEAERSARDGVQDDWRRGSRVTLTGQPAMGTARIL